MSQKLKDQGLIFAIWLNEKINWICLTPDYVVSIWIPALSGMGN